MAGAAAEHNALAASRRSLAGAGQAAAAAAPNGRLTRALLVSAVGSTLEAVPRGCRGPPRSTRAISEERRSRCHSAQERAWACRLGCRHRPVAGRPRSRCSWIAPPDARSSPSTTSSAALSGAGHAGPTPALAPLAPRPPARLGHTASNASVAQPLAQLFVVVFRPAFRRASAHALSAEPAGAAASGATAPRGRRPKGHPRATRVLPPPPRPPAV